MNSLKRALPLVLIGLVSCAPRYVSKESARLSAEAFLGAECFTFNCNPAENAVAPIQIPSGVGSLTLSCSSLEGIARVTLIRTFTKDGPDQLKTTLNVAMTATTASGQTVTASASATPSGGSYNLFSSGISEEFSATSSTFRIKGQYDLSSG